MEADLGSTSAVRGERYDWEALFFPYGNFDDLGDVRFLFLCIPVTHGGLGADFVADALVSEIVLGHAGRPGWQAPTESGNDDHG